MPPYRNKKTDKYTMRPHILDHLFASVTTLSGVGPKYAKLLENFCGARLIDLLWHLPSGVIDRRCNTALKYVNKGQIWTGKVRIIEHIVPRTPKQPYRIVAEEADKGLMAEQIILDYFKTFGNSLARQFPVGSHKIISGKIDVFNGSLHMVHPEYVVDDGAIEQMPALETIYPLTAGINNKILNKLMHQILANLPSLPEWQDERLIKQRSFPDFKTALQLAHNPQTTDDLLPTAPARMRLAYDELLANQLSLAIVRGRLKKQKGRSLTNAGKLKRKLLQALPYNLTAAQKRVLAEIEHDLFSEYRMFRLLQGDVGSGKTVVALLSMLSAVECGAQAAIMAPTEILAQQHAETITELCATIGIKTALLTGHIKGKARQELLADLAAGKIDIVIGTHALFTEDVLFHDLAYVIVDEQHRFGVNQRLNLSQKGHQCDVLVMTATPIPRTLLLTQFGDMTYSQIDELPPGRKPVKTVIVPYGKMAQVINMLDGKLQAGTQAYWVCPLVEESEKSDLSAAITRYEGLRRLFGEDKVGLVHGRMKENEKDAVMTAFKNGQIKLLVATTVIEVGVNVPNATVAIIEHAERFGLAQLHQLRGRIKRGNEAGLCVLMSDASSQIAQMRLQAICNTEDGFMIAEEDLRLRGGGEVLGTKQSGFGHFKVADLDVHSGLLLTASRDAALILQQDPNLHSLRGEALRILLYLFEKDRELMQTYNAG